MLHEEGHFDIGEIFARRLRKDLSATLRRTPVISPRRIDSIVHVHSKALDDMQKLYDNETNHSLVFDEQNDGICKFEKCWIVLILIVLSKSR